MHKDDKSSKYKKNPTLLISIIIPVYKVEKYLRQCIDSIRNQSYQKIEIILVDDGSPDLCPQMCDEFAEQDHRIKVIHKENGGALSARKAGVKAACGEYVSCIDGDDWIDLDFYENLILEIGCKRPDIIAYLGHIKEYEDGRSVELGSSMEANFYSAEEFEDKVLPHFIRLDEFYATDLPVSMGCYLFKRELLYYNQLKVDDRICKGEDFACVWRCILCAKSIQTMQRRAYHYRQQNDSVMHSLNRCNFEQINILYQNSVDAIQGTKYNEMTLLKKLQYFIFLIIMITDYSKVLKGTDDFLFPYPKVKPGSRIVIYGAGILGQQLVAAVKNRGIYDIVAWSDTGWEKYREQGMELISPDLIKEFEYDYLIIAVTRSSTAAQIKEQLKEQGILEDKIAVMDLMLLKKENLPYELFE